jgi:hypothetical protein
VTTTEKLQLPLCVRESVATHVTAVTPLSNAVPDPGVQTTVIGGKPFAVAGLSNETVGFWPPCALTD